MIKKFVCTCLNSNTSILLTRESRLVPDGSRAVEWLWLVLVIMSSPLAAWKDFGLRDSVRKCYLTVIRFRGLYLNMSLED